MRIIMYGTEICPDCVQAKDLLNDRKNIELDYRNITGNTKTLKEFLAYRDHEAMFLNVKEEGRIGIPFFILEDGTKTFEITDYVEVSQSVTEPLANSCSLDGKGHC